MFGEGWGGVRRHWRAKPASGSWPSACSRVRAASCRPHPPPCARAGGSGKSCANSFALPSPGAGFSDDVRVCIAVAAANHDSTATATCTPPGNRNEGLPVGLGLRHLRYPLRLASPSGERERCYEVRRTKPRHSSYVKGGVLAGRGRPRHRRKTRPGLRRGCLRTLPRRLSVAERGLSRGLAVVASRGLPPLQAQLGILNHGAGDIDFGRAFDALEPWR